MTTFRPYWPRLVPAALFSAAVALGIVGYPALAGAAPPPWDIEAYDDCMKKTIRDPDQCCVNSGGVPGRDGQGNPTCGAPWPEAQGAGTEQTPPKAGIPTALVQPPDVGTPPAPKLGVPIVPVQSPMVG